MTATQTTETQPLFVIRDRETYRGNAQHTAHAVMTHLSRLG